MSLYLSDCVRLCVPFFVIAQGLPHSFIPQFSNTSVEVNTNKTFTDIVKGLTSLFHSCTSITF